MEKKGASILKAIILLSIIGLITSLYLLKSHYDPPQGGAFCDFGESISCSLVNTSIYSEILQVPVALFGVIWFLLLGLMSWKALRKEALIKGILWWNILGIFSVVYLVTAEIILKSICPLCTLVHIIIIISLILSILLYRSHEKPHPKEFKAAIRPWFILALTLTLIPLILLNIMPERENYDALAQCMTEKGINMYGSFRCSVCARTRAMFGDSFQYINEIECHPQGENSQTALCMEKGIPGTPTWIMEPGGIEQKRHVGFMSIEELREFSGCGA